MYTISNMHKICGDLKSIYLIRRSRLSSQQISNVLTSNQVQVSVSGRGNCYDHAVMESTFGALKSEWIHHQKYKNCSQARTDMFSYIEGFYSQAAFNTRIFITG